MSSTNRFTSESQSRMSSASAYRAGSWRAHALALARAGAAVVVNDVGCAPDGRGADAEPAQAVVDEIERDGGVAAADTGDIGSLAGGGPAWAGPPGPLRRGHTIGN